MQRVSLVAMVFALNVVGAAKADDKMDVKKTIEAQIELIKTSKVDDLKGHFTSRLREGITVLVVELAKDKLTTTKIDDLVGTVDITEAGGKKTAKIKMKNGRSLTTMIFQDGKWQADTIWFK